MAADAKDARANSRFLWLRGPSRRTLRSPASTVECSVSWEKTSQAIVLSFRECGQASFDKAKTEAAMSDRDSHPKD
jgi:hypothetical protein